MSSASYSWMRLAWRAAPRACSSEGVMAGAEVLGARTAVDAGKMYLKLAAMRGVCAVPPESMTSSMSRTSRPAFLTTDSTSRLKPSKTERAMVSYRSRLMVLVKSMPWASESTLNDALLPRLRAFLVDSDSSRSLARLLAFSRGSTPAGGVEDNVEGWGMRARERAAGA